MSCLEDRLHGALMETSKRGVRGALCKAGAHGRRADVTSLPRDLNFFPELELLDPLAATDPQPLMTQGDHEKSG